MRARSRPEAAVARIAEAAQRCDAVLLGPGMNTCDITTTLVRTLLAEQAETAYVLDAGAICGLVAHAADGARPARPAGASRRMRARWRNSSDWEREAVEAEPAEGALCAPPSCCGPWSS